MADKTVRKNWKRRYLQMAKLVGTWSKDPKTQVGAVIIGKFQQVISQGYNGFPRKVFDSPERYNNREDKLAFVVHAEANAIYNAANNGTSLKGTSIYVHGLPVCSECAKAIIQSGIRSVVIDSNYEHDDRWTKSFKVSKSMFDEAGVSVEFVNGDK